MQVDAIWRYPVKSMGGEQIESADVGPAGIPGDRGFAVIDQSDGKVASAKHPRKWGALLDFRASYIDGPGGPASITFPSGEEVRTDDPVIDRRLADALGRDVTLSAVPPDGPTYEADWPDIDGVIPPDFLANLRTGPGADGGTLTTLAPRAGSFFDAAAVHLLASTTLDHLATLEPDSVFDVRRFRPNLVIGGAPKGFAENEWVSSALRIGGDAVLQPMFATMRCVMTTLGQGDLPRDPGTLRTIARHNRIEIPGFGTWSCVGLYAEVAAAGRVAVGDTFSLD